MTDIIPDNKSDQPAQWTVAVDLGILFDVSGPRGHQGAEDKLKSLEQLTESTKGKPVTIVVEALVNEDQDVPGQKLSESTKPYEVERIVIRDGKQTIVSKTPSKGLKDDMQDFLDFALTEEPANKVAFAINAHGLGDQGIAGGMQEDPKRQNGKLVSAAELSDVIKSSLQKSGRDKLDVIDFDSCLMAELGVTRQMNAVAKNVVASEKTETAGTQIDGQDITAWVKDLVANPSMNGSQLGKDIVNQANQGSNTFHNAEGTRTLVNFDLEHQFAGFNDDLNNLGAKLAESMKTKSVHDTVTQSIDRITDMARDDNMYKLQPSPTVAKRDLGGFLNLLELNIHNGSIPDPDHQLARAVETVRADLLDRSKFMSATHLPESIGFGGKPMVNFTTNEGGLSVFLPNTDVLTNNKISDADLNKLYQNETGTDGGGWLAFLNTLREPAPAGAKGSLL